MRFTVVPFKVFKFLLVCIGLLAIAHIITFILLQSGVIPLEGTRYAFIQRFNLDGEGTIGSWFSQVILLTAAVLLFLIFRLARKLNNKDSKYWGMLSVIFVYLSIDEAVALHEMAVEPVRQRLGIEGGYLYFAWIIPALIILALAGVLFLRFWRRLPRRTRYMFIVSLGIYLAGAVGVEMISANYHGTPGAFFSMYGSFWMISFLVEECLEMLGVSLFIWSLLDYIAQLHEKLTFVPVLSKR